MVREISREVNYLMESVSLLRHLGAGDSYRELKELLSRKYAVSFREGLRKFEVLEQIEREAERAFAEDMEQLRYYFPKQGDAAMGCPGCLTLLWEDYRCMDFPDTTAFGDYLRGLSEREYCEQFGEGLQGYTESFVRDTKAAVKMSVPYEVICYLMTMEIGDAEKWKLQKIFFDRAAHIDTLVGFLQRAEALLRTFRGELEELMALFYQYWSKIVEEQDFVSCIREATNVNMESSPLGFRLQASLLHPNGMTLHNDMGEDELTYEKPDYYLIGILFGEDFHFSVNLGQREADYEVYAVSVLKLLADKSKFAILSYIRDREAYGSELAKHLNLTTATVSHHMNTLFTAGLVRVSHIDNRVYYTANREALAEVLDYCKGILT